MKGLKRLIALWTLMNLWYLRDLIDDKHTRLTKEGKVNVVVVVVIVPTGGGGGSGVFSQLHEVVSFWQIPWKKLPVKWGCHPLVRYLSFQSMKNVDLHAQLVRDAQDIMAQIQALNVKYKSLLSAAAYYKGENVAPEPVAGEELFSNEPVAHSSDSKAHQITSYIASRKAASPPEISEALNIPEGTLYRRLRELKNAGTIKRTGKGVYVLNQI